MKFSERLSRLGFASYEAYLDSDHWREFKAKYRAVGRSMRCAVCNGTPIQLHHHTYVRLGQESLDDVTPLCRADHTAVHAWLKAAGKFVEDSHKAIAALRGVKPQTKKQRRRRLAEEREVDRTARQLHALELRVKADTAAMEARFEALKKRFGELRTEGVTHPKVPRVYAPLGGESLSQSVWALSFFVRWLERAKRRAQGPIPPPQPSPRSLARKARREEKERRGQERAESLARWRAENPMHVIAAAVSTGMVYRPLAASRPPLPVKPAKKNRKRKRRR